MTPSATVTTGTSKGSTRLLPNSIIIKASQPGMRAPANTQRLHYIPIALVVFFPVTFSLCYLIALSLGHINAFFAFISDAGTLPPEQNVFSQLVNMGSALFSYFIYIRYAQVDTYMRTRFRKPNYLPNVIAVALGFTSAFGMSIVGNFPELVEKEVHLLGAFMAFVGCSIYCIFQGYFTFQMLPHFQNKCIAYMRVFLGIFGLMLYFGAQTTILLAMAQVKNKLMLTTKPVSLKWTPDDGGYHYRAASVIMEWLLVVIFDIFILTFVYEFKQFKMTGASVSFLVDVVPIGDLESEGDFAPPPATATIGGKLPVVVISSGSHLQIEIPDQVRLQTEGDVSIRQGGDSKYVSRKFII